MLSFEVYREMGGGIESESLYARLSSRAAQIIRRATHGRADPDALLPEAASPRAVSLKVGGPAYVAASAAATDGLAALVQNCAFELIELMAGEEELGSVAQGRDVASVSNDGVSVSFASGGSGAASSANSQARYMSIIRQWLDGATDANGVHVLYGGVDA